MEVHLYGAFAKAHGPHLAIDIAPGSTVAQLAQALGLPIAELGPAFVDGRYAKLTQALRGGERVGLFPKDMSLVYIEVTYEAQEGSRLAYVPRGARPGASQEPPCR